MVTPVISRHKHDFNRYDAFGNAIGNSIVGKLQQNEHEKRQLNKQLDEAGRILNQGASNIVNGVQTDENNVTTDALTRQLQQQSLNVSNASGIKAADIASSLVNTVSVNNSVRDVGGINALSAQSRLNIQSLEHQSAVNAQARADTSIINAQRYADRTDVFRQQNPIHHTPVNIMDGIDVKGNLAWADYQRAEYEKSGIYAAELVYDAVTSTRDDAGVKFTLGIELGKNEMKFHADGDEAYFQYKNKTMKTNVSNIKGGGQNFSHRTTWNYAEGLSDTTFIEYDLYSGSSSCK
ncbi:MAG: hypothetical protein ACI9LM_004741 [Alteromonadaceae bacterium]|jgi:hypothetical protein